METQDSGLTQIERLAQRLLELKPDITTQDKKLAAKNIKKGEKTIFRYVNGKHGLMDADTAVKLIQFFEARISNREQVIND